jgi:16S rRNA (adenine1518-N6/adenine1519-N6)-dimethyltransferase
MAQIDALPPLREVIATHNLSARKALGQNFLLDLNLTSRIARSAGPLEDVHVIEVGPGPGGLTRAILAAGVKKLTVIETDERCLPALIEISDHYPGRLNVISGDALACDFAALSDGMPTAIIANLPYNIASPLIISWIQSEPWPPWFQSITVMVQKEYAERLVATPEQRKDYGRLSVLTSLRVSAKILFNVPPTAFVPQPKIMSSVVQLTPRQDAPKFTMTTLERVTQAAFGQRRKMLRQSLKPLGNALELLEQADISPEKRAEEIDPDGFVRLACLMDERKV